MLRCDGCEAEVEAGPEHPLPFRCPNAGDGGDHVLAPVPTGVPFPTEPPTRSFIAYRGQLHFGQLGLDELDLFSLVTEIEMRVAQIDGAPFLRTPFAPDPRLSAAVGCELWVKDETGQVAGSHKGRHLMGVLLHLEVARRLGWPVGHGPLAIASCGNAALAAAVLARAAGRELRVFIPPDAKPSVVARLTDLGATIQVCLRHRGEVGDPCYLRFREAVDAGATPFCCQGPDNGLCLDGGRTLGYELAGVELDDIYLQVGGGAFASSTARALRELYEAGAIPRMPRIHAVQAAGSAPLVRAWEKLAASGDLAYAAAHPGEYMWPWEGPGASVAHGILDDETYDWLGVLQGVQSTGGSCFSVSEAQLREANALAQPSADVSHTGSAGLAGVLARPPAPTDGGHPARVAVVFSGVNR